MQVIKKISTFAPVKQMVAIAQLVRASDCGPEGRGFEPHLPPIDFKRLVLNSAGLFFVWRYQSSLSLLDIGTKSQNDTNPAISAQMPITLQSIIVPVRVSMS